MVSSGTALLDPSEKQPVPPCMCLLHLAWVYTDKPVSSGICLQELGELASGGTALAIADVVDQKKDLISRTIHRDV